MGIDVETSWHCLSCGARQRILLSVIKLRRFDTVACVQCGHLNPLAYLPGVTRGERDTALPEPPAGSLGAALEKCREAFAEVRDCTTCSGKGWVGTPDGREECNRCHGSGCEPIRP